MKNMTRAYFAFAFVCIVWGTTYLAIQIGAYAYPPFLFAGVRQVVAAVTIMVIGYLMNRNVDISRRALKHQAIVGFLMITVGNGLVTWAEKYVPSGVAALICGTMPIWAVLFNLSAARGREKMNMMIVAGLLIGLGGVGLIFRDNIRDLRNTQYLLGIAGLFFATSGWALGSIINKNRPVKTNPVFNAGLQLLFGGIFLLCCSPAADNYQGFELINAKGLWSLLYLIVFGSVLAYTAYMYALRELPVGLVTSYAYINPMIAVIIGAVWNDEKMTLWTGFALAAIICGVFLVNQGYRLQHKRRQAAAALPAADTDTVKIEEGELVK